MAGEEVRATLRGKDARLGQVRARDLAQLVVGVERALAAAAYVTLGRPRRSTTGRHLLAVEAASRLRFRNVEPGSVVAVLALPTLAQETGETLGFGVDDLAGAAFDRLVASFQQPDELVDPTIARALAELAEGVSVGDRNIEVRLQSTRQEREIRLDAAGRARMRRLADAPMESQPDVLVGTLREADFDKRTARLRTAEGETVIVSYLPEMEEQVYRAMRGQAQFEGQVIYDPQTLTARRVEVRHISRPQELPFDAGDFWTSPTIDELAHAQSVGPVDITEAPLRLTAEERSDLAQALVDLDA